MFLIVRPFVRWIARDRGGAEPTRSVLAVMFLALLLSAIATEGIGIHAIFGAFLLGALVPPETRVARALVAQLRDPVTILLLPAFFAFTGMRTRIDLVSGVDAWLICGAIVIVATVGKFGGTFVAARLGGYDARFSAALATLMNTRGLMELIVLNVGLELGVISPALFSMMVIMAIVTTMATAPMLNWLEITPGVISGTAARK
jgi:Kef-type K+ transport system membrane component KefB